MCSSAAGSEDPIAELRAIAWAVSFVTCAVLFFEVALTRLFAVLLYFHFVFLALSCAICGLGVGAMLSLSSRQGIRKRIDDRVALAGSAAVFGLSVPLAIIVLLATPVARYVHHPLVVAGVVFVPFVAGGAFLSYAFHVMSARAGKLYFADLAGAAVGSLIVVPALNLLGGLGTCVLAGVPGMAACVALLNGHRCRWVVAVPLAGALGIVGLTWAQYDRGVLKLPRFEDLPRPAQQRVKSMHGLLARLNGKVLGAEWNAFARTDVVQVPDREGYLIYTDGEDPTNMLRFDSDLGTTVEHYDLLHFIGLAGFAAGPRENVLCIGPGGGLDLLLGLAAGSKRLVGVELNPSIPGIMYGFRRWNGSLYAYGNVELYLGEGRAFIRRSRDTYDLLYMALARASTTTTASGTLLESYLHTTEAFQDYLDHLRPNGRFAFVCDRGSLCHRAALTALRALERRGIPPGEGCRHLAIMAVPYAPALPYRYLLLVRRTPFSDADLKALVALTRVMGLQPLFIYGHVEEPSGFDAFTMRGESLAEYLARQKENVAPVSDDAPFFFDMRYGLTPEARPLAWTALVAALPVLGLWCWARGGQRAASPLSGHIGYFCLLGAGFMLVEVPLIQKLTLVLGYPTLTFSVVLFALLLSGGLGSGWSQRWSLEAASQRARGAAVAIAVLIMVVMGALKVLPESLLSLPITVRSVAAMALVFPLGFCLGIPFPTGIRLAGATIEGHVPKLWGVNGLMSATGGIVAALLAKFVGFSGVLSLGAVTYLGAALLARRLAPR